MARFYSTNAIYEKLAEEADNFLWATGSQWCLVYGDAGADPRVLVLAVAVEATDELTRDVSGEEMQLLDVMQQIAVPAELPLMHIRFALEEEVLTQVGFRQVNRERGEIVTMDELAARAFKAHGLAVAPSPAIKPVKDRVSSPYHEWQRAALGSGVTVSDLDLFRLDKARDLVEAFELKRSHKSLSTWAPYRDDYDNYQLFYRALEPCGAELLIVYNVYTRNGPRQDKADRVALFRVEDDRPTFARLGEFGFEDVREGHYP